MIHLPRANAITVLRAVYRGVDYPRCFGGGGVRRAYRPSDVRRGGPHGHAEPQGTPSGRADPRLTLNTQGKGSFLW